MNFSGKRVVVMGLGRFGGGLGVTRWLLDQGAEVLLTDLASESELEQQLAELGAHNRLQLVLGSHREEDFRNADLVIANPAVGTPWKNQFLLSAWDADIPVTTEVQLAVERLPGQRIIGVTGSSGKSTTAAMIYEALQFSGVPSLLGGNIGGSLLHKLDCSSDETVVVLELSSAMLWWFGNERGGGWSPHVAVQTNISPNHLDWHETMESYVLSKENIFAFQNEDDIAIRSEEIGSCTFEIELLGEHNKLNAATALAAAMAVGADETKSIQGIANFRGLPHRLQKVSSFCYNDSKSTTPESTKLAVDSFEEPSRLHLIVGGYDKNIDLSLIGEQGRRVAGLYAIGETASKILDPVSDGHAENCGTLELAVRAARKRMKQGDILLLSPGCASLDQFDNYEQRGEWFCDLLENL